MKKITYSIQNNMVLINVFDTELDLVVNFQGIYKGSSRKDCETWLKGYKAGLKKGRKEASKK